MRKFIRSFIYAWSGIIACSKAEINFRWELFIALIVSIVGWFFNISRTDWIILILCFALVLCLEMINTAIEKLADVVSPSIHPQIRLIKDIAAGAVLLSCICCVIIGLIIFIPKLLTMIELTRYLSFFPKL